jgi:hypothetical protein
MSRYKVSWYENANRHGGPESRWVKVEARGSVEANSGGQAIRLVKSALKDGHLRDYKCKDFKAEKK